jgi:hypothetical protein
MMNCDEILSVQIELRWTSDGVAAIGTLRGVEFPAPILEAGADSRPIIVAVLEDDKAGHVSVRSCDAGTCQ